jgi:hypothetical protein
MAVFWDVAPLNIVQVLPDYTAQHPRRVIVILVAVRT